MKSKTPRSITLQEIPMVELRKSPLDSRDKRRVMEVSISHYDGWNGGRKGYYLHLMPITIEDCGTHQMRGMGVYGFGGGGKTMIEEADRFNGKRLASLAEQIAAMPVYRAAFLNVLGDTKNDTELAPEGLDFLPESLRAEAEEVMASLRGSRQAKREEKYREQCEYAAKIGRAPHS
jgi:hypothetical protein